MRTIYNIEDKGLLKSPKGMLEMNCQVAQVTAADRIDVNKLERGFMEKLTDSVIFRFL